MVGLVVYLHLSCHTCSVHGDFLSEVQAQTFTPSWAIYLQGHTPSRSLFPVFTSSLSDSISPPRNGVNQMLLPFAGVL